MVERALFDHFDRDLKFLQGGPVTGTRPAGSKVSRDNAQALFRRIDTDGCRPRARAAAAAAAHRAVTRPWPGRAEDGRRTMKRYGHERRLKTCS